MMIEWRQGDILLDSHLKVIPVNIRGVLGAGLARQFRVHAPREAIDYTQYCRNKWLKMGQPLASRSYDYIFFPTKDHWRDNSELIHIESGLEFLADTLNHDRHWDAIAFPMLGCGLGGLQWEAVRPLFIEFDDKFYGQTIVYGEGP